MNKNLYAKNVSLIITTYQRSKFINLYLDFLDLTNFGGEVLIGDASSKQSYLDLNKQILNNNYEKFRTTHISIPKVENNISYSMNDCFLACLEKVQTKYVFLTCDDDLVFPETLDKLENILEKFPKYNGASGDICWVGNDIISIHGQNRSISSDDPIKRLNDYIKRPFHSMFTLVRKDVLTNFVPNEFREIKFNHFAADYSWILSIIINGPIKKINSPAVFRQWHGDQLNKQKPFINYKEFTKKEYYLNDRKLFINHLIKLVNLKSFNSSNEKNIEAFFEKYENFRLNPREENIIDKISKQLLYRINKIFDLNIKEQDIKERLFGYKSFSFIKKVLLYNKTAKSIEILQNKHKVLS